MSQSYVVVFVLEPVVLMYPAHCVEQCLLKYPVVAVSVSSVSAGILLDITVLRTHKC